MSGYRNAFRVLVGLAFGLCVAVFWVDNGTPVPVRFGLWELEEPVPLWLVALVAASVGMLFPRLLLFRGVFSEFLERRRLRKRVDLLEREVMQLRRLPFDSLSSQSIGTEGRPKDEVLEPLRTVTPTLRAALERSTPRPLPPPQEPAHPEILPVAAESAPPQDDPYASLFEAPDPALRAVDDAEITEAGS